MQCKYFRIKICISLLCNSHLLLLTYFLHYYKMRPLCTLPAHTLQLLCFSMQGMLLWSNSRAMLYYCLQVSACTVVDRRTFTAAFVAFTSLLFLQTENCGEFNCRTQLLYIESHQEFWKKSTLFSANSRQYISKCHLVQSRMQHNNTHEYNLRISVILKLNAIQNLK